MEAAPLDLAWDKGALDAFFGHVPALFARAQAPVNDAYQRLLYTIEHPLAEAATDAVEVGFGLPHPGWSPGSRRQAIQMLDGLRYPATAPIGELTAIPRLDLRVLSHYLHFFHHAYPAYDAPSCRGLARLGVPVPFVPVRDPEVYSLYIAAIEELKERIPFWCVPETNVYLTRIVQAALHAWGDDVATGPPGQQTVKPDVQGQASTA